MHPAQFDQSVIYLRTTAPRVFIPAPTGQYVINNLQPGETRRVTIDGRVFEIHREPIH